MTAGRPPSSAGLPPPDQPPLPPHPGRFLDLGPHQLFVRTPVPPDDPGERAPAVLVHGLAGASTSWRDLAALLCPTLDCLVPDLPGFGRSDPPPDEDWSLDTHVAAVARLIERHVGAPVHLLGTSLGGAVCVRLAAQRPDLVRSLVLVSPSLPDFRPRLVPDPLVLGAVVPGLGRLLRRRESSQPTRARVRHLMELCWADPDAVHPDRVREAEEEVSRRSGLAWASTAFEGSVRGLVAAWVERGERGLWRALAGIAVPVLVVWGKQDRLADVRLAERAGQVLRDGEVLVLEHTGHVSHMEDPHRVAEAVLRHVARSSDPRV